MTGTTWSNQRRSSLTEPTARSSDLEADDTATGPHRAGHLAEAQLVVGQVAHAEGDGGGVERGVLDRQRQRVADHERRTILAVLAAGPFDHPRPRSRRRAALPPGLDRTMEVARDLARAAGDIERVPARAEPGLADGAVGASAAPGIRRWPGS